ncbi:fused MFS/spermidine synthase [Thermodesulfobacteriota bacterium]
MLIRHYRFLFLMFLFSGFCSLLYQIIWVRMAYASFGVITPVLSVVISVFMLGLSIGSWAGGKWIEKNRAAKVHFPLILYGVSEAFIGIGAFAVPWLFAMGRELLFGFGELNSYAYLFHSAVMISISILPWCIFMGFTFPFMMAFIKHVQRDSGNSFSYLYFANVIGAMLGTIVTAVVLIEWVGFRKTLLIAAGVNFLIALTSFFIGRLYSIPATEKKVHTQGREIKPDVSSLSEKDARMTCVILFMTGFISMSMEVIWIRAFTPVLKTMTYSFASLLTVYLFATWVGSYVYRRHLSLKKVLTDDQLLSCIAAFSLLPIVMNDPRLWPGVASVLTSIFPLCAALGYLTPKLIDSYSQGEPFKGGKAYALNIIGCILGPLFASYLFLPSLGVKRSLLAMAAPFLLFLLVYKRESVFKRGWTMIMTGLAIFLFFRSATVFLSYEEVYTYTPGSEVRRDHTATVVSSGRGLGKNLLVNGIGITHLTPVTKAMAHLPLVLCKNKPDSALVICFGMGTTFRSLMSWDIKTTAVELVPSVKSAFAYYFNDADELLNNPKGKIVIDDGRRYLSRISEKFDVITIDPPPPIEAAGSSLLYSEEFYELAKKRLKKGGVLQQWFPFGEMEILYAVTRSLVNSFSYVEAYPSVEGWGVHFFASMTPIPKMDIKEMAAKIPPNARRDFLEWYRDKDLKKILHRVFERGSQIESILSENLKIKITDNRPYNEYYLLRRLKNRFNGSAKNFFKLPEN